MRGTEKQKKWAEEIRARVIETMQDVIEEIKRENYPEEMKAPVLAQWEHRMERLSRDDIYAGDIIELFKDYRRTGDLLEDLQRITSPYKINGADKIIG